MNEFINRQNTHELRKKRYGLFGNIASNGCGVIAAHNVLTANGIEMNFDRTMRCIECRLGTAIGFGKLGTNILSLMGFLNRFFALRIRFIALGKGRRFKECSSVIIMYYWIKSKRIGAHYIAGVRSGDDCFDFYNYSALPTHAPIEDFITGMKERHEYPLWLIGTTRKRGKKK